MILKAIVGVPDSCACIGPDLIHRSCGEFTQLKRQLKSTTATPLTTYAQRIPKESGGMSPAQA